jgi:hypothetical protein
MNGKSRPPWSKGDDVLKKQFQYQQDTLLSENRKWLLRRHFLLTKTKHFLFETSHNEREKSSAMHFWEIIFISILALKP